MNEATNKDFVRIARRVWRSVQTEGFRGSDPYDGLNSRYLAPVLANSRLARLAVIQAVKRSPLDIRPLLGVPKGLNPKGLALMLCGASEWQELAAPKETCSWLIDSILCLASDWEGGPALGDREFRAGTALAVSDGTLVLPPEMGWGYDFPWQSKAFLQPAFRPTVVATSFAVDALEDSSSPCWPMVAAAAGGFVAERLHRHEDDDGVCFSYSPGDSTRVYNASLFGARILAQTAPQCPATAEDWRALAHAAVRWVMRRQGSDGSWVYGDADHWQWIDNLHTGFNLETVDRVAGLLGTAEWDEGLAAGLAYYRRELFDEDGTARYYAHRRWPLDPHSFAQGALTFIRLARFMPDGPEFARRILARGIEELWDERRGGFRFQKQRFFSQPVIHMRWSQAWMFRALCAYLAHAHEAEIM